MLIGITCNLETVTDRRGATVTRLFVPRDYSDAILAAGGCPVLLSVVPRDWVSRVVQRLDGVVISGGAFDVPPAYYGEAPHPRLGPLCEERSAFEREVCLEAMAQHRPLLGICGGMQLLNVVLGGSLFQDLGERDGTQEHQQPQQKRIPQHSVTLAPESRLATVCGAARVEVNSTHHQAVKRLGQGLLVSAQAPDGVIEGVEGADGSFVLGVQWHPEAMPERPEQAAIYAALVQAARDRCAVGR